MKILSYSLSLILSFVFVQTFAQSPLGFNYQAVARDNQGALITSQSVTVKASILSGAGGSNLEYAESHTLTTDDLGHFNMVIGQGSLISGSFSGISWGSAQHHLKIEIDAGNGFVNIGTVQLLSVPYALSAKDVENAPSLAMDDLTDVSSSSATNGQVLSWNGTSWVPSTGGGGSSYSAGTGITISANTIHADNTTALWNANKLQGNTLSLATPSTGQVLKWDGSSWAPDNDNNTSYTAGNGITFNSGAIDANSATAMWNANELRGNNVSTTAPSSGEVLKWNGSSWEPGSDNNTSYTAGTGISFNSGAIDANVGTALWNANELQGRSLATTAPSSGEVLKWNGSSWEPDTDNNTSYTASTGITISSGQISANNGTAMWNADKLRGNGVSSTSPSTGEVLKWDGSNWSPDDDDSYSPWDTSSSGIYTFEVVGIGKDDPTSSFDLYDSITNTSSTGFFVSSDVRVIGGTGSSSVNIGDRSVVEGRDGSSNIGYVGFAEGEGSSTGSMIGGYFWGEGTAENNYGIRSTADTGASVRAYGGYFSTRGEATFNIGVLTISDNSANATNYGVYSIADSATTNYAGYFDGDLAYTGSLTNASDAKLKQNVEPYSGALSQLDKLGVKTYEFKKDGDAGLMNLPKGKQYGFIAQDVEALFPELVSKQMHAVNVKDGKARLASNTENKVSDAPDFVEYKGVNMIGMIPILTRAIQEQQEYIEKLEARIKNLENK